MAAVIEMILNSADWTYDEIMEFANDTIFNDSDYYWMSKNLDMNHAHVLFDIMIKYHRDMDVSYEMWHSACMIAHIDAINWIREKTPI